MPTALVISSMEVEGAGVVNEFSALGSAHPPNIWLSPVAYTLPATSNTTVYQVFVKGVVMVYFDDKVGMLLLSQVTSKMSI